MTGSSVPAQTGVSCSCSAISILFSIDQYVLVDLCPQHHHTPCPMAHPGLSQRSQLHKSTLGKLTIICILRKSWLDLAGQGQAAGQEAAAAAATGTSTVEHQHTFCSAPLGDKSDRALIVSHAPASGAQDMNIMEGARSVSLGIYGSEAASEADFTPSDWYLFLLYLKAGP